MSLALNRTRYGETLSGKKSRFLEEIDDNLLKVDDIPLFSSRYPRTTRTKDKVYEIPVPKFERDAKKIKKGILIRHPRFGKGVIKDVEGEGKDMKVTILFEEVGIKKVVVEFAKLEII